MIAPPPVTALLRDRVARFTRGCLVFLLVGACAAVPLWAWFASDIHGVPLP